MGDYFSLGCSFTSESRFPSFRCKRTTAHIIRCLSRLKAESIVFYAPQRNEESKEEEGPSENVKDAIEDHLVIHRDNVTALRDGPTDGVKEPNDRNVAGTATIELLVRQEARPEPTKV